MIANHLFSLDLGSGPKYPAQKAATDESVAKRQRLDSDVNRNQLTTWNQCRCIHHTGYWSHILRCQVFGNGELHVWIPLRNNGISPILEIACALLLRGMFRLALKTNAGTEFAEGQAKLDVPGEILINLEEVIWQVLTWWSLLK